MRLFESSEDTTRSGSQRTFIHSRLSRGSKPQNPVFSRKKLGGSSRMLFISDVLLQRNHSENTRNVSLATQYFPFNYSITRDICTYPKCPLDTALELEPSSCLARKSVRQKLMIDLPQSSMLNNFQPARAFVLISLTPGSIPVM